MVAKEILTLLFLVLIFLCLVSWTSVNTEAFTIQKNKDILQKFSSSKKEWANDYKMKSDSQNEQDRRIQRIEKMTTQLENKMEKLRDNFLIGDSGTIKVDPPCSEDDPLCIIPVKYQYHFKKDHFAKNLS